jgi:hypothetical protein
VIHVELAAAVLRQREEIAYRDWLLLRTAANGSGHCRVTEFRRFLKEQGYRRQNIDQIIQRLKRSGLGRLSLARQAHEVLVARSLQEMMGLYGLEALRYRVSVPIAQLKVAGQRGQFFALVQAGIGGNPVARETWEATTGVSRPTQIRAEKRNGADCRPNFQRVDLQRENESVDEALARLPALSEGHEGQRCFRRDNALFMQMPNSVAYPHISRRKRIVRRALGHCRADAAPQPTTGRRYFSDLRGAQKQREWGCRTDHGWERRGSLVEEDPVRWRSTTVGVWGAV